jgi:GDP-L-fucose synthase
VRQVEAGDVCADCVMLGLGAETEEVSIKEVADAIVDAVAFEGDYKVGATPFLHAAPVASTKFDTDKADGQFRKPAPNAKLLKLMGSFEFTPFRQAVKESVDWFVEHYESSARIGKFPAEDAK